MKNGYALASQEGLAEISRRLRTSSELEIDQVREKLRIGIQWDTQVTLGDCKHLVTQAYCSALPVAYSTHPARVWAEFAILILQAAYEATLAAAILNANRTGNKKVFLTLLGGGAFGNKIEWIVEAISRALSLYQDADLEIAMVSYGPSNPSVQELLRLGQSW